MSTSLNLVELFTQVPTATKVTILSGLVLPALSALLNRRPNFITGLTTVVLTLLISMISEWITTPSTFDLGAALGAAVPTLAIAWGAQARLYKDTSFVRWLYDHGLVHGSEVDITALPPAIPAELNRIQPGVGGEPPEEYQPEHDAPAG